MVFITPCFLGRTRPVSWALLTGLVWAVLLGTALRAQPVIETQPTGATLYESQSVTLNVVASGTAPLGYQWRMMGTNLPAQVLPSLTLTNVTLGSSALFDVVVTDQAGSVTSAPVLVVVLSRPVPFLGFGAYAASPSPSIPVVYTAFGGETNVAFSIAYDPQNVASPRFVSALTNLAGTAEIQPGTNGLVGVQVTLAGGSAFPPGPSTLGTVVFDAVAGAGRYGAGIGLTNVPLPLAVGPIGGTNFTPGILPPEPVVRLLDASATPSLDGQSGLFLHRLEIGNPSRTTNATVEVRVGGFTNDAAGHLIRVFNALGTNSLGEWRVFAKNLLPGEARALTVEFYVPDLVSIPTPTYAAGALGTISDPSVSARTLLVETVRAFTNAAYPNGAILIEFPTEVGRRYYVQYAPTTEGLVGPAGQRKTAEPAILGTGSRVQWVDYGPPKTDSPPGASNRFYRVIFGR